ncbi:MULTISPECIES: MBL fold metallo-hydrolase [unclassified Arthrobacter]|uniref:MBL fold metallo-hydrolase n=1 Tax=unclassified Arthrobacter TaxID=235627 RepID=UPI00254A63F5|nr:MBL fold metallo-hydrolase [Arthrobacter sp. fls2-241-R2A-172]
MSWNLEVAQAWYRTEHVSETITRIDEPHVHELLQANIWHVRGRDRDLVIDAGLGVASLQQALPELFANNPILVVSHAHLDHAGAAHEFKDRRAHPAESMGQGIVGSLRGPVLAKQLGLDWPDADEYLLAALPFDGYDPDSYAIKPAPITHPLTEGDLIDLGDRQFRVLHLPGHTPGSICLFDEASGVLFSGDVLYDDILLDELHESNIEDYISSMIRLNSLPVHVVHPGHGASFGAVRMRELIHIYLQDRAPHLSIHHP